MKHTSIEHPDHYFLESCLQRLGSFLSQLNDSIEASTRYVTSDQPIKFRK